MGEKSAVSVLLAHLAQWAVDVVYSFGYVGVFVLVLMANLHLLVPTPVVLPLAGFLVGQGLFSFLGVMVASTAGAMVGCLALYLLGFWIGEEPIRRFVERLERFRLVYVSDLDKAGKAFERHGGKAILISHLIPGVGALISIPAGIKRMRVHTRFTFYTVLGSALWNGLFVVLGWVLGANYEVIEHYAPVVEYTVLVAIVVGIALFVWHRRKAYK